MPVWAVRVGFKPGIYHSWDECKAQVEGFPGAKHKKFKTEKEAVSWLDVSFEEIVQNLESGEVDLSGVLVFTDGSVKDFENCSMGGYGIVFVSDEQVIFKSCGSYIVDANDSTRNVGAELLGAIEATRLAIANGYSSIKLVHDYEGIASLVNGDWSAKNPVSQYYSDYMKKAKDYIKISFVKVTAHKGQKWNEEADRLAALSIEMKLNGL